MVAAHEGSHDVRNNQADESDEPGNSHGEGGEESGQQQGGEYRRLDPDAEVMCHLVAQCKGIEFPRHNPESRAPGRHQQTAEPENRV